MVWVVFQLSLYLSRPLLCRKRSRWTYVLQPFKLKVVVDIILTIDYQVYNLGYVQKPPILDNVIDYDGNVSQNPDNEKFTSFEIGGEYGSELVTIKGSYYNTQ